MDFNNCYPTYKISKEALMENGFNIKNVRKDLITYDLYEIAVSKNPHVIKIIDKDIIDYYKLCKIAFYRDPKTIKHFNIKYKVLFKLIKFKNRFLKF